MLKMSASRRSVVTRRLTAPRPPVCAALLTFSLVEGLLWGWERSLRGGSVELNRFRAFCKWFSASVMPLPLRASAG